MSKEVRVKAFISPLLSEDLQQLFQRVMMTKFPDKADLSYDYAAQGYELHIVLAWTALFVFLSYRLLKTRDL